MIPDVPLPDGPILLDGGMGQELLARVGGEVGVLWSAQVLIDRPDLVRDVHEDFIRAGADIITTNTYTAIRTKLDEAGLGFLSEDLNRRAGKLATQARENAAMDDGRRVLIAGSLPPFYGSFRPDLVQAFEVIEPMYREQAEVLAPYVDFFLCETMSSAAEAFAAVAGAAAIGKPIWVSWTLEDHGSARLRSGETMSAAFKALDGQPVSGFLVNCCSPESITAAMAELAALSDQPVGGFANAFAEIPKDWESGDGIQSLGQRDDLNVESYASHVTEWLDAGARIVGGCCEVAPAHIARLRRLLDDRP